MFDLKFGLEEKEFDTKKVLLRKAVRAVIINDNNLFMIKTNEGDYKFPGGGIEANESHEEALKREALEETGYRLKDVKHKLGQVIESHIDRYDENQIFQMISDYYLCEISNEHEEQKLDDYEQDLDFKPIWINIDQAIFENDQLLKNNANISTHWLKRELEVLKAISKD